MKLKSLLPLIPFLFFSFCLNAQNLIKSNFQVKGDVNTYYPVTFLDSGFAYHIITKLDIVRSNPHQDSAWRGSLVASFQFHTNGWGAGSEFINANIHQGYAGLPIKPFVAGWNDMSYANGTQRIVIWLRGGTTTYNYSSNYNLIPVIYDGVQNPLPLVVPSGPTYSTKSTLDSYVNSVGESDGGSAIYAGSGINYFNANVGIGTYTTGTYKLAVEGTIGARKIKVTQSSWADFVFDNDYKLPLLDSVAQYIKTNKHLENIPTTEEIKRDGQDLGEMNKILLQKVEELTLYMIELNKKVNEQHELIMTQASEIKILQQKKHK